MKHPKIVCRLRGASLAALAMVAWTLAPSTRANPIPQRPNIVFYLADDQDYWDYGFAGNDKVETPNLDALASQSLYFTRTYAPMAICAPSRTTLYTGLDPLRHGVYMNHLPSRPGTLSLPHYLAPLGYETILAGKSHVRPDTVFAWHRHFPSVSTPGGRRDRLPMDSLERYFGNVSGKFCLILASEFPHGPYPDVPPLTPSESYRPPALAGQPNLKRQAGYYANIARDDRQVGQIIKLLKHSGKWENTIFIYASDHGISEKYNVYDRSLRTPLLVRLPGSARGGEEVDALLSFADLLPTLVELAGGKAPQDIDGVSFLSLLRGVTGPIRESVLGVQTWQNVQKAKIFPGRSLTERRFKLIVNFNAREVYRRNLVQDPVANAFIRKGAEAFPNRPEFELYDLRADPFENENLAYKPEYSEERERMRQSLFATMQRQGDFLLWNPPALLLKPTLHPLDKTSRWKTVDPRLEGQLSEDNYFEAHY